MWLVNCSILNMIWTAGLCTALLDCIVCGPFQRILPPNSWDQDKERTFTEISEWLADCWVTTKLYMGRFFNLRQTHTKLVNISYIMNVLRPSVLCSYGLEGFNPNHSFFTPRLFTAIGLPN